MKTEKGKYVEGTVDEINALFAGKTSQPKHTPGPWKVSDNDPKICVRGTEHLKSVWVDEKPDMWLNVAENVLPENARLIASAPDLLEALKVILPQYRAFLDETALGADKTHKRYLEMGQQAIAKAEGK